MNCLQAEERFSAHFEDELDYQTLQSFEAHLAECEACRHEYALFHKSVAAAQQLPKIYPSPNFEHRLQAHIASMPTLQEPETRTFWQRLIQVAHRPRWAFSGVMLLIFAAASIYFYQGGMFDRDARPIETRATRTALPEETATLRTELPVPLPPSNRQFLPRDLGSTSISGPTSPQTMQQHYVLKTVSYTSVPTRGGL